MPVIPCLAITTIDMPTLLPVYFVTPFPVKSIHTSLSAGGLFLYDQRLPPTSFLDLSIFLLRM